MATSSTIRVVHRPVGLMFVFTLLSWLGEYVHNLLELPTLTLLSPENSLTALFSLALFIMWWMWWPKPFKRTPVLLLLAWSLLHLIGGAIVSVIPFGFLPFYPAQTLAHYAAHVGYGLAQVPLIMLTIRLLGMRSMR